MMVDSLVLETLWIMWQWVLPIFILNLAILAWLMRKKSGSDRLDRAGIDEISTRTK